MTVHWILFVVFWGRVAGDCDANTGPPGGQECVSLADYNTYQFGTCITDAYMRQKSRAAYQCKDQTRVFCYYQCMLENHGKEGGPVYDDCACDPSSPVKSTSIPLPAKCYSPDGTDCSWYRDCLEAKYQCSQSEISYAIDYGEKFCNLYTQNYYNFTEIGRKWIDAVRKCLQVALVPLIRQYKTVSCSEIKETAFDSHSRCYTSPFPGAPSICHIFSDWLMVLSTIKPAFSDDLGATTSQLVETALTCERLYLSPVVEGMEVMHFVIESVIDDVVSLYKTLVRKIQNFVKETSSDDEIDISPILPEKERNKRAAEDTIVNILLLSRAKFDLNYKGNSDVNVTAVVVKIMNAIEKGDIYFGSEIRSVSQCDDFHCTNSSWTVIPPIPPINGAAEKQISIPVLISSGTVIPPIPPINGTAEKQISIPVLISSGTVIPPIPPINGAAEKQISIPVLISSGVILLIWSTV